MTFQRGINKEETINYITDFLLEYKNKDNDYKTAQAHSKILLETLKNLFIE